MERAPAQCIICGADTRERLIALDQWTVYRCTGCDAGFLDPRPDERELNRLYETAYFDSQYGGGLPPGSPDFRRRISQEDHRIRFFRNLKKRGTVLDVGCGMGYFLFACREAGYRVRGVDISDHASSYVAGELGISVETGNLKDLSLESGSADVVTMWHFLEHAPNPGNYLEEAGRWLAPGGLLVVDVPNYRGTDAQKTWERWVGWQVPYHLYHYTPESLARLLDNYGFSVIRTKDYHSEHVKNKLKTIPGLGLLARPIAKFFSGTSHAVVARKNRQQQGR